MSLLEHIRVNTNYTRSINLERDIGKQEVVQAYIPTTRSRQVLSRIISTLNTKAMPRAWALTGPYGSGKSAFGVFLSHLVGNPTTATTKCARKILLAEDPGLIDELKQTSAAKRGCLRVLLTGTPEPFSKKLLQAIGKGATAFQTERGLDLSHLIRRIDEIIKKGAHPVSEVLSVLEEVQEVASQYGASGILLIIDEFGKFLEYEARHYDSSDIYLLQAIAERAAGAHKTPLLLVVLLHQSFDRYAKRLVETTRKEWQKIEGRFENIPFLESTEQVLRVMATAFSNQQDAGTRRRINTAIGKIIESLFVAGALPFGMNRKEGEELFASCYPLHPLSALILPVLCQRVAQNERTLFGYFGSREPYGFHESLARMDMLADELPWILPSIIYDYFIMNQPATISDHFTHRRWAEVVSAIERLGDAPSEEIRLLKTIGILNIIGVQAGLKASPEILSLCSAKEGNDEAEEMERTLKSLQKRSLITFRKYSGEFRVWQGSDFDLETAVKKEREQLDVESVAETLNARQPLLPLVARRYSIMTGNLRYFFPIFIDRLMLGRTFNCGDAPSILVFLAETPEDEKTMLDEAIKLSGDLRIGAVFPRGSEIRDAIYEVLALQRVQRNNAEIGVDPVAQHELKDRLDAAIHAEKEILGSILSDPSLSHWCYGAEKLTIKNKRILQEEMSRILRIVFKGSPVIKNEMINTDKLSSSAAAARNRLLMAMLEHSNKPYFGIDKDKFPPEKAIYKALFEESHIHCTDRKGDSHFIKPYNSRYNMRPVWEALNRYYDNCESQPLAIADLFAKVTAPPYGLKAGVIPILFLASYLARDHELALYEDGRFFPLLTYDVIERLLKNPKSFSVQLFKVAGIRVSIYEKYKEVLGGKGVGKPNILSIARPLAKFMKDLPEFTKKTKTLSQEALRLREAYFSAKSPGELLFKNIPIACGFEPFSAETADITQATTFARAFMRILREMNKAYDGLLNEIQKRLEMAFPDSRGTTLTETRRRIGGRFSGIENFTVDTIGVKAFALRLCDPEGDDRSWLEGLATFLARKPAANWSDDDLQIADFRLADLSMRLRDLEKLRIAHEKYRQGADTGFRALLLRIVGQGIPELEEVVYTDEKRRRRVAKMLPSVNTILQNLPDEQHQLALLLELLQQIVGKLKMDEKGSSISSNGGL